MFASGKTATVASAANYIEDVFSTYLYTGNSSTQTINNGIDLAGKGGLTWIKVRDYADSHRLFDTSRGVGKYLVTNGTFAETTNAASVTAFNSNGFSLGDFAGTNGTAFGSQYASWTFREQPKFFDVVTWTGNGVNDRAISHALGSTPGCIIIKRTDNANDWYVYHRSLASNYWLLLNSSAAQANAGFTWTTVSSTSFTVPSGAGFNASGGSYVAYLFAHNAGGFGLTGTDNVISCGSYVGTEARLPITLGYEPQWVMIKDASTGGTYKDWYIFDNMRKLDVSNSGNAPLLANSSAAEGGTYASSAYNLIQPTSTGMIIDPSSQGPSAVNTSGDTYIYIAIRRGPMKVPTSGTSVYATSTSDTVNNPEYISNFPVDMEISTNVTYGGNRNTSSRLLQGTFLFTNSTNAESAGSQYDFSYMNGWATNAVHDSAYRSWMWRRAPSFFDEVCYTGNSTPGTTITHNLSVAPELIIVKQRNASRNWIVGNTSVGWTKYLQLNSTTTPTTQSDIWTDTDPTSTVFTVGSSVGTNQSGSTYVAYLFATCAGVSKVGSYTGNGSTQTINCGFTGGARFVLIKCTSTTGDWYVYDTARGMTTLTDPYLLLNSTAAETATLGSVTTVSTGFALNAGILAAINASGGSYIFLAIS